MSERKSNPSADLTYYYYQNLDLISDRNFPGMMADGEVFHNISLINSYLVFGSQTKKKMELLEISKDTCCVFHAALSYRISSTTVVGQKMLLSQCGRTKNNLRLILVSAPSYVRSSEKF